jgi:phosphoglycolate phosphatase-like HAD superfamily hydrolase
LKTLELKPDCVICGDTTPHTKPHPAPLLRAAEVLELSTAACWYVGDDLRDIQAARASGIPLNRRILLPLGQLSDLVADMALDCAVSH